MHQAHWQLKEPLDAVAFDCDSTLSQIEGIDVLADHNGVLRAVHTLTERAMSETGVDPNMYCERLALVKPHADATEAIGERYYAAATPGVEGVIRALHLLNKRVFVISAGIYQAVVPFAMRLGIARSSVFAVRLMFDEKGHYINYDEDSPLIRQEGKREIIEQLQVQYPRMAHVGDGMNDVAAAGIVERFIGYGGSMYRASIARVSDFYITAHSLASALPLLLTAEEEMRLDRSGRQIYEEGLRLMEANHILLNPSMGRAA
ncbi:MAG: hypothetical protein A3J38_01555 [Gammaproteobacteria bacterium RIFCSPHIGHO2_12_FULL_45_9]|nr:MAG: hypothetical protein A3J38_01555 [Gammaproteobacteria bacterium RIFCSPHIGHO2_12_FULL_45_9]